MRHVVSLHFLGPLSWYPFLGTLSCSPVSETHVEDQAPLDLQRTFETALFSLKFHWNLFLKVWLIVSTGSSEGLTLVTQNIFYTNVDQGLWSLMAPRGNSDLSQLTHVAWWSMTFTLSDRHSLARHWFTARVTTSSTQEQLALVTGHFPYHSLCLFVFFVVVSCFTKNFKQHKKRLFMKSRSQEKWEANFKAVRQI